MYSYNHTQFVYNQKSGVSVDDGASYDGDVFIILKISRQMQKAFLWKKVCLP